MISRWANKKREALKLRQEGNSLKDIEKTLSIPRSTLSGWFRSIKLTREQQTKLDKQRFQGLINARLAAARWHNAQKAKRLEEAAKIGSQVLEKLASDVATLELALAFLYLGEGCKTRNGTSLGSSDPQIAKFFITCLKQVYAVPVEKIKCYLHLRADQDSENIKRFWSEELSIPLINFMKVSFDKRTEGRPTYPHYKGVCVIECGRVDIQRRLVYIASGFCAKIRAVSSVG